MPAVNSKRARGGGKVGTRPSSTHSTRPQRTSTRTVTTTRTTNTHSESDKSSDQDPSSEDSDKEESLYDSDEDEDEDSDSDSDSDSDEDSDEDKDEAPVQSTQQSHRITPAKRTAKTAVTLPTLHNYHKLGLEWGLPRADRILARRRCNKKASSAATLFEAQALQAQYHLDKTMLCIHEGVSRAVLDEELHEGPLAREPNSYTNFQTYSLSSTTTAMPQKGQSAGFLERNRVVGNTWSNYTTEEQMVFSPKFFEPLCQAAVAPTIQAPTLTTPTSTETGNDTETAGTTEPAQPSTETPQLNPTNNTLTSEQLTTYLPIFKRLVNLRSVTRDFKHGRLCRHSGNATHLEQVAKKEIKKVVRQLFIIFQKFKFHFHLLTAAWHPDTSLPHALYQSEETSCEHWAQLAKTEYHLLERFALTSTQAPSTAIQSKKKAAKTFPSSISQGKLRKELITQLNSLIEAHLPNGRQSRADAHPQGSNPHHALLKRVYRGNIRLAMVRLPGSKVSKLMLTKGPTAGKLSDNEVRDWLSAIENKKYLIVKAHEAQSYNNIGSDDEEMNDD